MTSADAHHSAVGEEASSRRARAAGAGVNFLLKEKDHTLQKKVVQSADFSNNEAPFRLSCVYTTSSHASLSDVTLKASITIIILMYANCMKISQHRRK